MVATQAKVVRNGKTAPAKVTATAAAKEANVSEKTSTTRTKATAASKAAPAKAASQATAKTTTAKAKVAQAETQATPYWQYSRETLAAIYAALTEMVPTEALDAVVAARDTVGTKTAMALVVAAAKGVEPNYDRLMKGRE